MDRPKVLVFGRLNALAGRLADVLTRKGYEPMAVGGFIPRDVWVQAAPQMIVVVGEETTYSVDDVEYIVRGTEAPTIVVSSPGTVWAAWAERMKYPLLLPEQAAEAFEGQLERLIEQSREHDRERYLRERYRAEEVIVTTPPRAIGFCGPKGGTGKTTTAVNAAILLAAAGLPVRLVDSESDTRGNIPDLLRMGMPGRPITASLVGLAAQGSAPSGTGGVFEAASAPRVNIWTNIPPPKGIRWNLQMVAGLLSMDPLLQPGAMELMARAAEWLDYSVSTSLREGFVVVIDAGNNLMSPLSVRAINRAEILYIVLDPEDTALVGGASWLASIYRMAGPDAFSSKVRVVFNRVRNEDLGKLLNRLRGNIEEILQHRLPRAIPGYMLPYVDIDYARAQTNTEMGIENLFVLQVLSGGSHADALLGYYSAMVGMLGEHFPVLTRMSVERDRRDGGLFGRLLRVFGRR